MMWRHPGCTVVSVMALALGIGLVSAQFSFIKGVMLTELPFEGGEGVMHLRRLQVYRPDRRTLTPVRDYRTWMAQQKSFESLAAYTTRSVNLHAPGQSPQRYKRASFSASVLSTLRVQPILGRGFIPADEQPGAEPVVMTEVIDERYFRTVGLFLLQGREFQANDSEGSEPVAIVNRSFVQVHWPDGLPIGRRLRLLNYTNWITVIGVAPDLPMRGRSQQGDASSVYLPQSQHGWGALEVLMRVRGRPRSWESSLRQTVWELAPDLPVHSIQTMESALSEQGASTKLFSKVFTLFGVLAVFLAMLGVYGVMSFTVAQRTREFGIRLALGAQPAEVRRLVLALGIRYLVIGLPVAFLLAYGLSHPFEVVMTNVSRLDPVPYAIVAVALSLVVTLTAWLPARRAANIDPMAALRCE